MRSTFKFSDGVTRESKTRFAPALNSVAPAYDELTAHHGETLSSITTRAYGPDGNTLENQRRIMNANPRLVGQINVPR